MVAAVVMVPTQAAVAAPQSAAAAVVTVMAAIVAGWNLGVAEMRSVVAGQQCEVG